MLGFSRITWPKSQVTKGGVKENLFWSDTQLKVFPKSKNHLSSALVLTLLDLHQPFEIEIDTSNYYIGAILNQ